MNLPTSNTPIQLHKVAIVGAGAIGGWLGAGLAGAGCDLSLLARGATLQALQQKGLRLRRKVPQNGGQPLESEAQFTVKSSDNAADLGPQDLVVIAVKGPALAQVAAQIAPLLRPGTLVLVAMNGVPFWFLQGFGGALAGRQLQSVDPGGHIAAAFSEPGTGAVVVGGVVHASCSVTAPGIIQHHFGNGMIVGEPSGQPTPRVQALTTLLTRAGFEATLSPQIQKDVWFKLWGNMTVNPISALTGATTDLILADPLVRNFVSAVMLEAKEIGARLGISIDQQPEDRHQVTLKLGAFKTSMLQDVEAGRAVELDALVSVVRELGELTQTPTPFTDALLGLSRLQARKLGLY